MVSAGTRKLNILLDPPCSAHPPALLIKRDTVVHVKGGSLIFYLKKAKLLMIRYILSTIFVWFCKLYFSASVNCISFPFWQMWKDISGCERKGRLPFHPPFSAHYHWMDPLMTPTYPSSQSRHRFWWEHFSFCHSWGIGVLRGVVVGIRGEGNGIANEIADENITVSGNWCPRILGIKTCIYIATPWKQIVLLWSQTRSLRP